MPLTGRELRAERRAAEISQVEVARRMGISRMTLWKLESDQVIVTQERVRQYHAALQDAIEASSGRVA